MNRHLYIPDTQVKPGVPLDHLVAIGNYLVEKKPDVIILAGDFADMESLSSYDKGKRSFEGRRYQKDIETAHEAMEVLWTPLKEYNTRRRNQKMRQYRPRRIITLGNHEYRIERAINDDARLEGTMSLDDLAYENWELEVYPFLEPVEVDGVTYSHYAQQANSSNAITRAHLIAQRRFSSWTVGHQQGLDYFISPSLGRGGKRVQCMIAGSYYMHDEDYKFAQGNQHWRGCVLKNEVQDGQYDPCFLSLEYLLREWL